MKDRPIKLCIIGDPVEHSKSPVIQTAMMEALGFAGTYDRQRVRAGELPEFLARAREEGYTGFNATMPQKEALIPQMDELDPLARVCGAVNTVCIKEGKYYGYNTDGPGFLAALAGLGVEPRGKEVLLLGAGGAAKAVSAALCQAGARVTVCNRTRERAEELCRMFPQSMAPAGFDRAELERLAGRAGVLVNCTSLGMEGQGQFADLSFLEALPREAAVCDAIYAPPETQLLRRARELGHPTMNGMGMLLGQAVLALGHFTGASFDREVAMAAALRGLEG